MTIKKKIHVNQHNIRANTKAGNKDLPVFTIKTYKSNTTANEVQILGPSVMVYSPDKPLSCGAKVWMETEAKVYHCTETKEGIVNGVID